MTKKEEIDKSQDRSMGKDKEKKPSINSDEKKEGEQTKQESRTDQRDSNSESNEEFSKKIEELEKEKRELEELVKRVAADFDNYRKSVQREKEILIKNSSRRVIEKILPVLDNFELALKDPKVKENDPFVKGIELIFSQLLSLLEQEGLKPYNPLGKKFDPNTCEILLVKYDDKEEDLKIIDVVQKGYFLNDTLIRPAKVVVVKRGDKHE